MNDVHFSSATDEWPTPKVVFDGLNAEFGFTLDPCATPQNAKCPKHFTRADNGLTQDWSGDRVFMNPPYGREIGAWMKKAFKESLRGALVVCLVPARTDTEWWHRYAMRGEIRLYRGRIRFEGGGAPSAIPVRGGGVQAGGISPDCYMLTSTPITPRTVRVLCDGRPVATLRRGSTGVWFAEFTAQQLGARTHELEAFLDAEIRRLARRFARPAQPISPCPN